MFCLTLYDLCAGDKIARVCMYSTPLLFIAGKRVEGFCYGLSPTHRKSKWGKMVGDIWSTFPYLLSPSQEREKKKVSDHILCFYSVRNRDVQINFSEQYLLNISTPIHSVYHGEHINDYGPFLQTLTFMYRATT